ncbi:MAG: site-specific integrase, partial [Alistipes sp.]
MLSDNKNGVSVKLIHDTRLKNKEGLFSIRVQVIYQRTAKYYNTGKKMSVADWEKLPTSRLPEMVKIRNSVKDSFDIIMECVEDLFS